MRLQAQSVVRLARGQLLQPVRQSAAVKDPAGTTGRLLKAVDRDGQLVRIAFPLGKLAGAGIGLGCPSRAIPSGREQRRTPGQLQLDLSSITSRAFG